MKILMLAPEPFFQPRGTPISIYFRLKALSALGHEVDLVTYPLGEDRPFDKLRILRVPRPFFIRKIKIGPSMAKIPLDFLLFWKAVRQLLGNRYDLIFSHEEAGFLGAVLGRVYRVPHLYDMHSSLPQQLENFEFTRSKTIKRIFRWMERFVLKRSQAVIVICQDLLDQVKAEGQGGKTTLLENFIDFDVPHPTENQLRETQFKFGLRGKRIVLYTGNFQSYQGVPLLLEAAREKFDPNVVFLFVGGTPEAVKDMTSKAERLKILDKACFTGPVQPTEIPLFIALADVLVSPRISGTNTPLKIYSFLKSGKPVVATDLWTHTQLLTEEIAVLVKPEPKNLAEGITFALNSPEAQERAQRAKELADRDYTFSRYLEKINSTLNTAIRPKPSP